MAEKKQPDWERIEADYRAGVKSIREVAAEHGITDTAIRKRAKRDGWERDLSGRIASKADQLVRTAEVRAEVRTETTANEQAIIDANAQAIANVKLAHRSDIRRYRSLVNELLTELEAQTGNLDDFKKLAEIMADPEADSDRLNAIYHKVIGLPQRTKVMIDLANALKVLITLERESYGIVDAVKVQHSGGTTNTVQHTISTTDEFKEVLHGIIDKV